MVYGKARKKSTLSKIYLDKVNDNILIYMTNPNTFKAMKEQVISYGYNYREQIGW